MDKLCFWSTCHVKNQTEQQTVLKTNEMHVTMEDTSALVNCVEGKAMIGNIEQNIGPFFIRTSKFHFEQDILLELKAPIDHMLQELLSVILKPDSSTSLTTSRWLVDRVKLECFTTWGTITLAPPRPEKYT